MKSTSHSEYHKLETVYLKTATAALIHETKIAAEWKSLNWLSAPALLAAKAEYHTFEKLLAEQGIQLLYFPEETSVSMDAMYCRDASIDTNFGMIMCSMGKEQRRREPAAQQAV